MIIRKTIVRFLLIMSILFISPICSYAGTVISSINFNKTPDNKIEIKITARGSYRYYINPQGENILNIDIKDANLSNNILNKLNNLLTAENGINKIKIAQLNDNSTRISLFVKDVKAFQFLINAPGGVANPYGFDFNPKEIKAYTPPAEVKVYAEKVFATKDDSKDEVNPETQNSIKTESNKKSERKESKKATKVADKSESTGNNKKNDFDDDLTTTFNMRHSSTTTTNNDRLSEDTVVVPENFKLSATKNAEPAAAKPEEKVKPPEKVAVQPKKEVPEEPEFKLQPVPKDKLLSILNSEQPDEKSIPRLTAPAQEEEVSTATTEETTPIERNQNDEKPVPRPSQNKPSPIIEINNNNSLIQKITPLPKGKVSFSGNNMSTLVPPGAKIITVGASTTDLAADKASKENSIEDKTVNLYEPRELNPLPIGLSEEIVYMNKSPQTLLEKPVPKPGLASDGTLAFTIMSSKGIVKVEAPKRSLNQEKKDPVVEIPAFNSNNMAKTKTKVVDNTQIAEFKKIIREAKHLYALGQVEEAEQYFKLAISKDPTQPWGYLALADFYEVQKKYAEAVINYKSASKLLPNKPEIIFNIALNYYKMKDFTNAEDYLSRVINLSPNFTLAYYNLGTLLYKEHKYDDSIDNLKKALELNPLLVDAHYNIGLAYLAGQNKTLATKHFDECNNIDSEDQQCKVLFDQYK